MSVARPEMLDCEYFQQDEVAKAAPRRLGRQTHQRRGFTLHGHRLSSLYRASSKGALTLMPGYQVLIAKRVRNEES